MASDVQGQNGLTIAAITNALASPALRNASLACIATAGIVLSVRSWTGPSSPPSVRPTSRNHLLQRKDQDGAAIPRSESIRSDLTESNHGVGQASSNSSKSAIAIFWDVDNCSPNTGASGHHVAQAIRQAAQSAGPDSSRPGSIVSFKAYLELSSESLTPNAAQVLLRSELQGSGVSLIDTPKSGRKDVADKMMIADLLSFAIDKRPPALIVLLSGDRDFAYPLGILRNRGYEVLLITPPTGATPILEASATYKLRWRQDVLALTHDAHGRPYDVQGAPASRQAKSATPQNFKIDHTPPQAPSSSSMSVFAPLIHTLDRLRNEGHPQPLRSLVSQELQKADPRVFEKAQANSWGEYVAIAEAASIVTLGSGSQPGREWITLSRQGRKLAEAVNIQKPSGDANGSISNGDVAIFIPLIQACKQLKQHLPEDQHASSVALSATFDKLIASGLLNPYEEANVNSWDEYIRLAYRSRIARLAPAPTEGQAPVVQLHPKLEAINTGMEVPESCLAFDSMPKLREKKSNRFIEFFSSSRKDGGKTSTSSADTAAIAESSPKDPSGFSKAKDSFLAKRSLNKADANAIAALKEGKKYPHNPSGEMIHVTYFPMANMLLTQRQDGIQSTPEDVVFNNVSRHYKMGRILQNQRIFQEYLARAVADDIVTVSTARDGKKYVQLAERLAKGEGEGKHQGHVRGQHSKLQDVNGSPRIERSASPKSAEHSPRSSSSDLPLKGKSASSAPSYELPAPIQSPSAQFGLITPSAKDRQKFKVLVDALVTLRRQATMRAKQQDSPRERYNIVAPSIEPLRSSVMTLLLSADPLTRKAGIGDTSNATTSGSEDGSSSSVKVAPGAWLQLQGNNSFAEFFGEAERKGFIHLLHKGDGREHIRLAHRYEEMFFGNDNEVDQRSSET